MLDRLREETMSPRRRSLESIFFLFAVLLGALNLFISSVAIIPQDGMPFGSDSTRISPVSVSSPSTNLDLEAVEDDRQSNMDVHGTSSVSPEKTTDFQDQEDTLTSNSKLSCIRQNEFCRYDDIGDFLEDRTSVVHEPLPCVPSHRRIPHEKANDWQYILDQRAKLPEDGSMTALMDYNAMLIPLYKNGKTGSASSPASPSSDLDPVLLDRITGRYHPHFSDADADRVQYLSISRTSNLHSCKPKFKFHFGSLGNGYLGISLLDEHLARIEGTDIAVNVDKWLLGNMTDIFHDFQVLAVRSSRDNPLKDQLFLFVSSHIGTFAFPMDIRRVPPAAQASKYDHMRIPWESKLNGQEVRQSPEIQYGDGFQLRFMDNPGKFDKAKSHKRPDRYYKWRGVDRGKNFHVFESTSGETFMEIWPYGRQPHNAHITVPINFYASNFTSFSELNLFPNREFKAVKARRYESVFNDAVESHPVSLKWSFQSKTPKHERPYMRFRGTSNTIDMMLDGTHVKVGISHTVSEEIRGYTDRRAYLSQFYAFLPTPPFDVVAVSGHFCFNHMRGDDVGYSSQWISERPMDNRTAPIRIMGQDYRCPIITFASSMVEKIGNDGKDVIITYGVDDCYSRSIVVPKKKIEILLLGDKNNPSEKLNVGSEVLVERKTTKIL